MHDFPISVLHKTDNTHNLVIASPRSSVLSSKNAIKINHKIYDWMFSSRKKNVEEKIARYWNQDNRNYDILTAWVVSLRSFFKPSWMKNADTHTHQRKNLANIRGWSKRFIKYTKFLSHYPPTKSLLRHNFVNKCKFYPVKILKVKKDTTFAPTYRKNTAKSFTYIVWKIFFPCHQLGREVKKKIPSSVSHCCILMGYIFLYFIYN